LDAYFFLAAAHDYDVPLEFVAPIDFHVLHAGYLERLFGLLIELLGALAHMLVIAIGHLEVLILLH
jgi:hypothetical protein